MADKVQLREDDLTFGDLCDFEAATGRSLSSAFRPGSDGEVELDGKTMLALVWIAKRWSDPDFTLDDARRLKVSELELVPAGVDPTPGAEPISSPPSATSGA